MGIFRVWDSQPYFELDLFLHRPHRGFSADCYLPWRGSISRQHSKILIMTQGARKRSSNLLSSLGRSTMRYMLLIYSDEKVRESMSTAERKKAAEQIWAVIDEHPAHECEGFGDGRAFCRNQRTTRWVLYSGLQRPGRSSRMGGKIALPVRWRGRMHRSTSYP